MTTTIRPHFEQFLIECVKQGDFVSEEAAMKHAFELLASERRRRHSAKGYHRSLEDWEQQVRGWAANHTDGGRLVDDSRDCIYGPRGQ